MAAASAIAIIGLAVSAAGAYMQHEAAQDAADAQRSQADAEQRRADIQHARQVRAAVRQARVARGSIINQGALGNTSQSTGVLGGVASVGSQLNSNLSYLNESAANAKDYAAASARIGEAQADAATAGAIGSLGGTIFSGAGGFKTIFGKGA